MSAVTNDRGHHQLTVSPAATPREPAERGAAGQALGGQAGARAASGARQEAGEHAEEVRQRAAAPAGRARPGHHGEKEQLLAHALQAGEEVLKLQQSVSRERT